LSKEQVQLAFQQFDTNGDDKLDYREFCAMIRRKEEENLQGVVANIAAQIYRLFCTPAHILYDYPFSHNSKMG